jgi:membrane protease YdiL (CAAX protease family)
VFVLAVAVVLTAWNNAVVAALPSGWYVPANLAAAGLLVGLARAVGLSWRELGLARADLSSGARWGGALALLVAAGYVLLLAVPAARPLLDDARVAGLDAGAVAYRALVRIPLGTVLWEEVAFRGVLLAALARLLRLRSAVAVSAAVFGVWHVRPTLQALAVNDLVDGPVETALAVALGCAFTAAAGILFAWLRLRSGSLLAPALLHVATNSLGLLAAAVVTPGG